MKRILNVVLLFFLYGFTVSAQVIFKPDSGFLVGKEKYTPMIFGNNKFRMEHTDKWLRIYIPSPNPNSNEYTFNINDNGYIGIGRQAGYRYKLDVGGDIACGGTFICYQTERPYGINTGIDNAYEKILSLSGKSYVKNKDLFKSIGEKNEKRELGFIAQELEEVLPSLVRTDEEGYKAVNYLGIVPLLIEAVKVQKTLIEEQAEDIDRILGDLNRLEKVKNCLLSITSAGQSVELKYKVNPDIEKALVCIYTVNGVLIKQMDLPSNSGIEVILKSEISPGVYFYNFVCDGIKVDSGSLSI